MVTVVHKADMRSSTLAVYLCGNICSNSMLQSGPAETESLLRLIAPQTVLLGSIVCTAMYCTDHDNDYVCSVDSKEDYRLQEVWLSDV